MILIKRAGCVPISPQEASHRMKTKELNDTITALFAGDKGLLAMDESTHTINKRFEEAGIPQTVEFHRAYREMIVTTPGLGKCISGAILYDETIYEDAPSRHPYHLAPPPSSAHPRLLGASAPARHQCGMSGRTAVAEETFPDV